MASNKLIRKSLRKNHDLSIIGKRYGYSIVLEYTGEVACDSNSHTTSVILLQCDCGNIFKRNRSALGKGTNCGCKFRTSRIYNKGSRLPYTQASFNELYSKYKSRAKYTNKKFSLTKEQFKDITSKNCYYCGVEPLQKAKNSNVADIDGIYLYNGIDRVDSSIGYIFNNCVPSCEICNKAKRDLSLERFNTWLLRIAKKYKDGV